MSYVDAFVYLAVNWSALVMLNFTRNTGITKLTGSVKTIIHRWKI
jgi:hypothetical protein